MKNETKTAIGGRVKFVLALALGLALGYPAGVTVTQWAAIEQDAAHYHAKTGNIVWGPAIEGISVDELTMPHVKELPMRGIKK